MPFGRKISSKDSVEILAVDSSAEGLFALKKEVFRNT
jgi:hypothetical protein